MPPAVIEMGIDMGIVVFKVESNWGGDLTCLYRVSVVCVLTDCAPDIDKQVRVHGNMLDGEQDHCCENATDATMTTYRRCTWRSFASVPP